MAAKAKPFDALELEAKRKDDNSWHPCQVSLSPSNSTSLYLTVDFGSSNSTDTISSEEEALARLRVCSIPLQNGQCSDIKEGEHVLALHKVRSRSLYFDAELEKAWRIKHSNKVYCRCTFEIKWLHLALKGQTVTLPSSSIRKLSVESIYNHPTVALFLNSLKPLNSSDIPSCVSLLDDTNSENELHSLLEKQIEEISKSAHASQKANSEEILLGLKRVDLTRSSRSEKVVSSHIKSLNDQALYNQNNARRTTRSRSKLQVQVEPMDRPIVQPTPLEPLDKRPCLSPLAARAALAALRCELPNRPQFFDTHVSERDLYGPSRKNPNKQINAASLDATSTYVKVFVNEKASATSEVTAEEDECREPLEDPKSTVSTQKDGSKNSRSVQETSRMPTKREKPARSTKKSEKLNRSHTIMTRVTRSTVNRTTDTSTNDLEMAGKSKYAHKTHGDGIKGNGNKAENEKTKKRKSQSTFDAERNQTEEKKRSRMSTVIPRVLENQAKISTTDARLKAAMQNASGSKMPVSRFSVRLRFLPRTRSQKKT